MPESHHQTGVALGDYVEITTATAHGSVTWEGYVCISDGTRANVITTDGTGCISILVNSPDLRVLTQADPAVASCPDCQANEPLGHMLCGAHTPRALR